MTQTLYCDRCNSESVDIFLHPDSVEKPDRVSMSEWAAPSGRSPSALRMVQTVHILITYVAQCRACGHRVTRQQ